MYCTVADECRICCHSKSSFLTLAFLAVMLRSFVSSSARSLDLHWSSLVWKKRCNGEFADDVNEKIDNCLFVVWLLLKTYEAVFRVVLYCSLSLALMSKLSCHSCQVTTLLTILFWLSCQFLLAVLYCKSSVSCPVTVLVTAVLSPGCPAWTALK